MMVKSICFTGHRHLQPKELVRVLPELHRTLTVAITKNFLDFYTGGALGWDTYCAQTVLELREQYPGIALHLVLPCSPEEQTLHWNAAQREAYYEIYHAADSCDFVAESYSKACMKKRNQRLVEAADCCVCYCRDEDGRTGTAQTVRMARQKGIPVINLIH